MQALLHSVPPTLQQATADPRLHQRLLDTPTHSLPRNRTPPIPWPALSMHTSPRNVLWRISTRACKVPEEAPRDIYHVSQSKNRKVFTLFLGAKDSLKDAKIMCPSRAPTTHKGLKWHNSAPPPPRYLFLIVEKRSVAACVGSGCVLTPLAPEASGKSAVSFEHILWIIALEIRVI